MSNTLEEYIRPVKEGDEKLPEFSHSRLECYQNCPYQYCLKYVQEKTTSDTTIALECGSLAHKVLELKGQMISDNAPIDYDYLLKVLEDGYPEENIIGKQEIKKKYWEVFSTADSEGRDYNQKFQIFEEVLKSEMEDKEWHPVLMEHGFDFVYKDRIRLHGFIDRIDKRGDDYRIIDYKTSKKVFDEAKNKTSQQFAIYNAALLVQYGKLAVDNIYRFIFINDEQHALSDGWEKRFITKMDKVLDAIDKDTESKIFTPKATPLCHWCNYSKTNPEAKQYRGECEYYSLWTPTNKTFEKNKEFDPNDMNKPKRRLSF